MLCYFLSLVMILTLFNQWRSLDSSLYWSNISPQPLSRSRIVVHLMCFSLKKEDHLFPYVALNVNLIARSWEGLDVEVFELLRFTNKFMLWPHVIWKCHIILVLFVCSGWFKLEYVFVCVLLLDILDFLSFP